MKRKWFIPGISIFAVILLTLTSISNIVGYQSVQTSQQNLIKERINQREILFQTIVDIANNKEIQRIILKSQMSRGVFPTSEIPVVTKNQIKMIYFIGLVLSKVISKSRIQSMVQQYQFNPDVQKEISAAIEKDTILKVEMIQLKNSECDCEKNTAAIWHFPIICAIIYPFVIMAALFYFWYFMYYIVLFYYIMAYLSIFLYIGIQLRCNWYY